MMEPKLWERASRISMLVMDVDGVMTDGKIVLDGRGRESKSFHVHDGVGIKLAHGAGLQTAVITQRMCDATRRRAKELGIGDVLNAGGDKQSAYRRLVKKHRLRDDQVAYIGDDLPDLAVLKRVGLAVCPATAPLGG